MSFIEVLKMIIGIAVDVGTGVIVGHYTGNAVKKAKGASKVCAMIAASAISGLVASKATGYLSDQIDEIDGAIRKKMDDDDDDEEEEEDD